MVFHMSLLQPTSSSEIPNKVVNPPPIELDDSNMWEVSQILDSKFNHLCKGSCLIYLVEWKGFDNTPDATSWELPKHLANAPNLVRHSIGPIQISQPPKFLGRGLCLYFLLYYHMLNNATFF